jgi:ferritin-like metal-binding protein YciE
MKTLAELFEHTLQDIYYAENALVKALPKMAKAVKDAKLKQAFEEHLVETRSQIATLKKVFASVGLQAVGQKCDAIEGLIKETDGLVKEADGTALNAGVLAAAQAVEHYEIARYGSLREWAKVLGHDEAHTLLSEILDQEKAANSKLTNLAVEGVNSAPSKKPTPGVRPARTSAA